MLRGYTAGFNDFEKAILKSVAEALTPEARGRFEERIARINRVYRLDGGSEVIAYEVERSQNVFPSETAITRRGIVQLARFAIVADDDMTSLSGSIVLNDGNFGIIKFDRNSEHADATRISKVDLMFNVEDEDISSVLLPAA